MSKNKTLTRRSFLAATAASAVVVATPDLTFASESSDSPELLFDLFDDAHNAHRSRCRAREFYTSLKKHGLGDKARLVEGIYNEDKKKGIPRSKDIFVHYACENESYIMRPHVGSIVRRGRTKKKSYDSVIADKSWEEIASHRREKPAGDLVLRVIDNWSHLRYVSDGKRDHWKTPSKTAKDGFGDCDEFASNNGFRLDVQGVNSRIVYGKQKPQDKNTHFWAMFRLLRSRSDYVVDIGPTIAKASAVRPGWYEETLLPKAHFHKLRSLKHRSNRRELAYFNKPGVFNLAS